MKIPRILLVVVAAALFAVGCSDEGNVFSLEVGTCFNDPGATEVSDLPIVECSEAHDNEVIALYDVTEASLPSQLTMLEGCLDRFEAAIGTPYANSIYDISAYTPSSQSWDQGDREVVCYAYTYVEDGGTPPQITGSVLNSGK